MRIAAVHSPQGKIFGAVEGDSFRPFSVGGASLRDLRHVIRLVSEGTPPEYGTPVALARAKLAAPVGPLAKNVICVGKNYHDHAQEFARSGVDQSGDKQEAPADPVIFTKSTSSLADPFQKISASSDPTHTVDYEGEFGVVIGKRCKKSSAPTRSTTFSATPSSTTSPPAPCSSATSNGFSARVWTVSARSGPGW